MAEDERLTMHEEEVLKKIKLGESVGQDGADTARNLTQRGFISDTYAFWVNKPETITKDSGLTIKGEKYCKKHNI